MALVFLGLGTNLGNKNANLENAIVQISNNIGLVTAKSKFYKTKAVGFESENIFLNAVVSLETEFSPVEILRITQQIEQKIGRKKKSVDFYSDRIIDIDILLYDNIQVDLPELKIPHPLIASRDFVLIPLLEIAPTLLHPITGRSFSTYL